MPSSAETCAEKRAVRAAQMGAPLPPVEQDPLPCPRCSSKNTKFCYYNNYNFSQPRHFCKSCRRYWTQGGTLRDVPVGGGSRKTAKRPRTSASSPVVSPTASLSACSASAVTSTATSGGLVSAGGGSMGSNYEGMSAVPLFASASGGGFASLLSLGGFGAGLGLGLDELGFGLSRGDGGGGVSGFPDVGFVNAGGCGGGGGGISVNVCGAVVSGSGGGGIEGGYVSRGMDTWRIESGGDHNQGGYVNVGESNNNSAGECFAAMPELAISTPGNGLN